MAAELRRILLEAAVIVTLGVVIGLSLHYPLLFDAFSGDLRPAPAATGQVGAYPQPVVAQELERLLEEGGLAVDARSPEAFAVGHLAGARSLPLDEVEKLFDRFRRDVPLDRSVIVYCSGYGCPDSFDLGVLLLTAGYRQVYAYEGGFPEWRDGGRPVAKGAP